MSDGELLAHNGLKFCAVLATKYAKPQALLDIVKANSWEDRDSIARAGDEFDNMCWALNYADGIHKGPYARYIANGLAKAVDEALDLGLDAKQAMKAKLAEWKGKFELGEPFWKQTT